jgi:hypothetical protein
MRIGIGFRGHDRMSLSAQSLLHEARFPVVLRATMRLDEDFHESADGHAGIFAL